jgi:hypothetical protein
MRYCTRCILPSSFRGIRFDAGGVCAYCRTYEELKPRLTDFTRLRGLLEKRFDRFRGRFPYDVLVGISGGKDSSYLVRTLKREYGLKVLCFTYENGFTNESSRDNIKRVVDKLEVEHFFHRPDWTLHRAAYRSFTKRLGLPCLACTQFAVAVTHKIALERRIPFAVHGRSRAQMFRELAPGSFDLFLDTMRSNLSRYDEKRVKTNAIRSLERIGRLVDWMVPRRGERQAIKREFLPDLESMRRAEMVPEYLAFFLFHPYDEERMKAILESEIGWERPAGDAPLTHHDCRIHDATSYLYQHILGYSLLALELSVAVREGAIGRDQALDRLGRETALREWPSEAMGVLEERLDLSARDIRQIVWRNRQTHRLLRLAYRARSLVRRAPALELFDGTDETWPGE